MQKRKVIGTVDVENERQNAFGSEVAAVLEACRGDSAALEEIDIQMTGAWKLTRCL
jgi:hypothetical protein